MAPSKSLPPAAKQNLVLSYMRSSRTCHTIRDLEKALPAAASINSMQVKDYIQALTDDNKIHVEKIGSGNWYWAWAGEERKEREKVRQGLLKDLEKGTAAVEELKGKIATINEEIAREQKLGGGGSGGGGGRAKDERKELIAEKTGLDEEVSRLQEEMERFMAADGAAGVEVKEGEIRKWKTEAEMWTDNLYVLEGYLKTLAGGDREVLEAVKKECYGEEYVEGEGLKELDD